MKVALKELNPGWEGFRVHSGSIERISLSIPWTRLYTGNAIFGLCRVFGVLSGLKTSTKGLHMGFRPFLEHCRVSFALTVARSYPKLLFQTPQTSVVEGLSFAGFEFER